MAAPTNVLTQYTMQGQLLTNSGPNAYEWVYWDVYNTPDLTGVSSGYFGQLQNIAISASVSISSPNSGAVTPTSAAGGDLGGNYPAPLVVGIGGIAIVGAPSAGQELQFNGTTINWVTPTVAAHPTPRITNAGGAVTIPLNADSWDETGGAAATLTFGADTGTFEHVVGWFAGTAPTVVAPLGWVLQSPVDGVQRTSYVYGTGGNPVGERYTWRAIVALNLLVPT
jgi:hypothetical protein